MAQACTVDNKMSISWTYINCWLHRHVRVEWLAAVPLDFYRQLAGCFLGTKMKWRNDTEKLETWKSGTNVQTACVDVYDYVQECQTFRTIDFSYHLWTFRTMDDSYHGLFVSSLDFSYRCENFSCFRIFKQSIEGGNQSCRPPKGI